MMGIGQHKFGLATEFYTEVFIDWIDVENKILAIIFAITKFYQHVGIYQLLTVLKTTQKQTTGTNLNTTIPTEMKPTFIKVIYLTC